MGPSMDRRNSSRVSSAQVLRASEVLGIDAAFASASRRRRKGFRHRHRQARTDSPGVAPTTTKPNPGHRHISQLFALHPSNQITVHGTHELAKAARATIERRLANGGGHSRLEPRVDHQFLGAPAGWRAGARQLWSRCWRNRRCRTSGICIRRFQIDTSFRRGGRRRRDAAAESRRRNSPAAGSTAGLSGKKLPPACARAAASPLQLRRGLVDGSSSLGGSAYCQPHHDRGDKIGRYCRGVQAAPRRRRSSARPHLPGKFLIAECDASCSTAGAVFWWSRF